nr:MAG TPA: hypothetical protein [Ackermannviridae sp.]
MSFVSGVIIRFPFFAINFHIQKFILEEKVI